MATIISRVDNGWKIAVIDDEDDETVNEEWVYEMGEDEKDQYEAFRKVLGKITEIEGPGTHGYRLEVRLIEYTKRGEENGSSKTDKA